MSVGGPDLIETLALLAIGAGVSVFCGWRAERPHDIAKGPRFIPWTILMLTGVVFCLVMIVHLVNMAGVTTGRTRF